MIKLRKGEAEIKSYTAPASTAFDFNDVVTTDASGNLAKATSTTLRSKILGLIQRTILTTDSDYASAKVVPVQVVDCEDAEFEATVSTGTLVQAMVNKSFDLDDEDSIDVNSNLQKCVTIVKVLSTTLAVVKFNTQGDSMKLVSYQEVITAASFTDGGSTSGTKALSVAIPAGAVFERSLVSAITGFAGDVSASLIIGDGSDTDRYNTGTPSIFTTAAAGADMGAPSGTMFHSAATTPTLTVTSNADFTSVLAGGGSITVTLFWYQAS